MGFDASIQASHTYRGNKRQIPVIDVSTTAILWRCKGIKGTSTKETKSAACVCIKIVFPRISLKAGKAFTMRRLKSFHLMRHKRRFDQALENM
jgi:hypothetical protein